ncbi:uncharacterized protein [Primulina huaijiensis]|uniref:uncharacterized protein n=1 Tax=Primulina huaijiensis TaxID=1492673 RepID=UPI003CC77E13
MRYKSWPYFNDWCEILGNDRATGERYVGFTASVQAVLNMSTNPPLQMDPPQMDTIMENILHGIEEAAESISATNHPSINDFGSKKVSGKKRKRQSQGEDLFVDVINNFTEKLVEKLSELGHRGGRDDGKSNGNKKVFDALGRILELAMNERVVAATMLVDKPSYLEIFFSLLDEARISLVRWLLNTV